MVPEQLEAKIADIHTKLEKGKERMDTLETLIDENRKAHEANALALQENTKITKEIKEILDLGKSFFLILGWVGKIAKWIAAIGTAAGVLYALYKGQVPPISKD